ncbi:hypothetical protein QAD02_018660 [Eretmocerus hayati]|uniref:Uncharacterized protein n=1 Tax=Eretmocerus hayati TaxID=131215 RepID=A0ACC2PHD0_9HYME|nr:hypothetical protein QAD02_018660 [Eretmocerus hayati]
MNLVDRTIVGSDDCLFLNVYAKSLGKDKRRPVMVWIHGGGFQFGSGNDDESGPDYLIAKDIILVTINYRLGVLGFLNLGSKVASGNQGLKDQVMALQWVRDNIFNFGGDPHNVTIFGESAGGASVHYLSLSPLAKGLFHKAIIQSGVIFNPWATKLRDEMKKMAYKLCEILGKKARDDVEIVNFLRSIDVQKLVEAQEKCLTLQEQKKLMFAFVPGADAESKSPFMPFDPTEAAQQGVQLPLLIGCTSREGIIFHQFLKEDFMSKSITDFRQCLQPNVSTMMKMYDRTIDDLRHFYLNDDELNENNHENMADLLGDVCFVEGIHRAIKIQVEKSSAPTYFYRYTYDRISSGYKKSIDTSLKGATHQDELVHLFRTKKFEKSDHPQVSDAIPSVQVMELMVELWVNFASTGRPTPTLSESIPFYWQPVTNDSILRHLNICEEPRMEVTLSLEQMYSAHKIPSNGQ